MALYKPKNSPYWHYEFQIDGLRFRSTTRVKDKRLAARIEQRARSDYLSGALAKERRTMTLGEGAARFWQEHGAHEKAHKTVWGQICRLHDMFGADTRLDHLSAAKLAGYISQRRAQPTKRGPQPSNATINRELQLLRRLLNIAREIWQVETPEIPWRRIMLTEAAERVREISPAEERALIAALPRDLAALARFCIITGARLSSAIKLTWRDVDHETGILTFRQMKSRQEGRTHVLPITPALRELLDQLKGQHPIYVLSYECRRAARTRARGERYPFTASGWRRTWKAALAAAGISDLRFHDTRHTAGSRIVRATGNLKLGQGMLGHSDIAATARYAHASQVDVARGMTAMSRTIPEKKRATQGRPT